MLRPYQKSTGTRYVRTVALALTGMIASPAALFLSQPVGWVSVSFALSFTVLCAGLAWDQWNRKSELTLLSISVPPARGR